MLADEDLPEKARFSDSAQRVAANVGDDAAAKRSLEAACLVLRLRLPGVFMVAFQAFFRWLAFFLEEACGWTRGVPNIVLLFSLKSFGSVPPKPKARFFVDLVGMF